MKLIEVKMRVDYRLKPLVDGKVRLQYGKSEFSITEYEWYDSSNSYIVYVSDRKDPLEFTVEQMKVFLSDIKRKDKQPILPFDQDGTQLQDVKPNKRYDGPLKPLTPEEQNKVAAVQTPTAPAQEHTPAPAQVDKKSGYVHIESTVKVYVTKDYGRFGIVNGNRSLNKNKIKRIKDEIAAGTNMLPDCPILVVEYDGKLRVIDGQHRLEVAKQIGSYVYYIIREALSLHQIAMMNSNTEKWTYKDFINCYVQNKNDNYTILRDYMAKYQFPISTVLQLLGKGMAVNDGGLGKDLQDKFQQGKFVVHHQDDAERVGELVLLFKNFPHYSTRHFVLAICKIISAGKVEVPEVHKAYVQHADMLTQQDSWKEYLACMELMLNKGKSIRKVIY